MTHTVYTMDYGKIKQLQGLAQRGGLYYSDLAEIEAAFNLIPDDQLRDLRENALVDDMLDELEAQVSPTEKKLYDYIAEHYGESEAQEPSYSTSALAAFIDKEIVRG